MKIVFTKNTCKLENCTEREAIAAAFAMVQSMVDGADSEAEKRKLKAFAARCSSKMLANFVEDEV